MADLRRDMCEAYRCDEEQYLKLLLPQAELSIAALDRISDTARKLITEMRNQSQSNGSIDKFLLEYDLSSEEGVVLMCLAEALLRIPDKTNADKLIADQISRGDWGQHLGSSKSTLINAATWALFLTGKLIKPSDKAIKRLMQRSTEPVIRTIAMRAVKIMGEQFVIGKSIEDALNNSSDLQAKGYKYSYDMLGEEAITATDAAAYYSSYMHAIDTIGKANTHTNVSSAAGISVKLSALYPRYEWRKRDKVFQELFPKLLELALAAKKWNLGFTIDAEEAERLDLSLDIIAALIADPSLQGWQGLGLAVQAYQKRAPLVIDYIIDLARKNNRRLMLRLVKGAYWDSEIKASQERGLIGYPVFTRKAATDVCFIACIKKLFAATDAIYPQIATHNAYSLAVVLEIAGDYKDFEFQCLYGMGQALYANIPCRIYAPVGEYRYLLAYLVRRLLENGANTSFVKHFIDANTSIEDLIKSPYSKISQVYCTPHPKIPLPKNIYEPARTNSRGIDFTNPLEYQPVLEQLYAMAKKFKPAIIKPQTSEQLVSNLDKASNALQQWSQMALDARILCFHNMALLLEQHKNEFISLIVLEGRKTILDAHAEVREAIDYCWYYSYRASLDFKPEVLNGITGEYNQIKLHARGVIVCISPWNFPLAIFLGQCIAALLAGNTVLAKPAGQTPHIAQKAIKFLHKAGVPEDAIQFVNASGTLVSEVLLTDQRVNGVMLTGSTETATRINQILANRPGPIVPFIAETGGQNVMLVDSSALPEQVVKDVITSAFGSAGQRCSSLRVLYVQHEIADQIIEMLSGAMAQIAVGDPKDLATDVGPIIDTAAYNKLCVHRDSMKISARLLYEVAVPVDLQQQDYFGPCAFEINCISELHEEIFGPILHVVRYSIAELEQVMDKISATQYGLTLGIHSRIQETIDFIIQRAKVGNIYVNRNMIGAVVGVQPFGGEGLSGTGPKAGGPNYLSRLALERVISVNTSAIGGNASLVTLSE
jgi:RHH-type proline utilization regulon transcriptional repressor/proline dehydrogenase/delta 1-pyrroline-5-carboxylate dehydrogenase